MRKNLAKLYKRKSLFDPTHNYSHIVKHMVEDLSKKRILNVGAGKERLGDNVTTLDLYENADINADAVHLPFKSATFDAVISIAVLEHLKEPQQSIGEMYRVLKKGGEIYVEVPFLQPFHASPHDYFRVTQAGLRHWLKDFEEIKSGVCVGPGSSLAWISIEYTKLITKRLPGISLIAELLMRAWLLPLKIIDGWLVKDDQSHITASAIYFHGRKT